MICKLLRGYISENLRRNDEIAVPTNEIHWTAKAHEGSRQVQIRFRKSRLKSDILFMWGSWSNNFALCSAAEQERLILRARQQLSPEEALAADEEAYNLLSQQQQDLTYITVPTIAAHQNQVCKNKFLSWRLCVWSNQQTQYNLSQWSSSFFVRGTLYRFRVRHGAAPLTKSDALRLRLRPTILG